MLCSFSGSSFPFPLALRSARWCAPLSVSRCEYWKNVILGEANRANVDAMSEHFDGPAHDEIARHRIRHTAWNQGGVNASKIFGQLLARDAEPRVANVDARVSAPNGDSRRESGLWARYIFYGVADEISECHEQHALLMQTPWGTHGCRIPFCNALSHFHGIALPKQRSSATGESFASLECSESEQPPQQFDRAAY